MQALELEFYPAFLEFHCQADGEGEGQGQGVRLKSSVPQSLVDDVVYRRHLDLQYMSLPNPHVVSRRKGKVSVVAAEDGDTHAIAYEHFRATFDCSRFYSIKKDSTTQQQAPSDGQASTHEDVVNTFFKPLTNALRGDASQVARAKLNRLQLELTGHEDGLPAALMEGPAVSLSFDCLRR